MLTKRIIPCLDVNQGQVVKGQQFQNHETIGEIIPLVKKYCAQNADELIFYEISASPKRTTVDYAWIASMAKHIDIPFCVAGGISTVKDAEKILASGADKISINIPALLRPDLITELAYEFGSQCIVIGIDSMNIDNQYFVYQDTSEVTRMRNTKRRTRDWISEVISRGAGEIVLNSMSQDGMRQGYDLIQLKEMEKVCTVPLIASGGAGSIADFYQVFSQTQVSGAMAASVFHNNIFTIEELKKALRLQHIPVRL